MIDLVRGLKIKIEGNLEFLKDDSLDQELIDVINTELEEIISSLDKLEINSILSSDYDKGDCIFEIHSGAGGTEACDWAMMIYRMYTRYFDNKGYTYEVIDSQPGDEVGIKHVSMIVHGSYAYGYLKSEIGVHRLVRLSPFDANNKRHTSFASVLVTPVIDNTSDIVIKDDDLKIDVFRSGGAGGQSVNTADSAVRITHLPTKIVVSCQNERSQLQNKEKAMSILKNKLKLLEIEKQEKEMNDLKGVTRNIEFGSQIRSYVLHPYSLIKDHRTNVEASNVDKVLDGDLDLFIESYLRMVK